MKAPMRFELATHADEAALRHILHSEAMPGAVVLATIFAISGGHGGNAELLALAVAGCFAALAGVFSILRVRPGKQH